MKLIHLVLGFLALAGSAMAASNTTLYETSFEPPAFTPGLPLRGQDNWEMYHDGEAISVATTNARTGTQCLRFEGALLEQNGPSSATAYCFSRALEAYSNSPPAIVELTASVRLDGPQTGTNGTPDQDILSANLMAIVPRGDGQGQSLGGFFVSSAGKIWSYSPNTADSYKYSVPYTFGTYRTLRLRIDFVARTLRYFVDGDYLGLVNERALQTLLPREAGLNGEGLGQLTRRAVLALQETPPRAGAVESEIDAALQVGLPFAFVLLPILQFW